MRISQFNSTKLLIAVIGLLIGAFVMLSMSLPDEQVGEGRSNHSGPRRSHWKTTSGCGGDNYNNETDYGQIVVIAEKGDNGESLGTISVSADHRTSEPKNNNNVEQTTITWNCGLSGNDQVADLAAAHKNTVTIDVTPGEGYYFSQWRYRTYLSDVVTHEASGTTITYLSTIGGGQLDRYSDSQKDLWEDKNKPWVDTIWICFAKQNVEFDVTFNPAEQPDCSYTVDGEQVTTAMVKNSGTSSTYEATLAATAGADWKFAGWFVVNDDATLTFKDNSSPVTLVFNERTTITAKFVPSDAALFKVDGKEYLDLNAANTVALTSTSKTIILAADGKLYAGDYTISSGVTLLIPDDREVVEREEPTPMDAAAASNLKPFRTLTMGEGSKINVDGAISVASKLFATAGGKAATQSGVKTWYGYIFMNQGSEIVLNGGGVLYAWGYISGAGEITARNGARVYEMFQFTDFRGGSVTYNMVENKQKVFPFLQYYIQNVEAKLNIECGATEYVRTIIYMGSEQFPNEIMLIGKSGALFTMKNGVISKQYIPATDRMHYVVDCDLQLNAISLSFKYSIFSKTITSSDYVLPINNNMTINILANSSFELSQDMACLPGTELNIEKGATLSIPSGTNLYVYDLTEWQGDNKFVYSNAYMVSLNYVAYNGNGKAGVPTARTLSDARIKVDGELEVTGGFYTTTSGADIYSTGGGSINYKATAGTSNNTYQVTQSGTTPTYVKVPITSSRLHNLLTDDVEYTSTTSASADTTINYRNGHWGWLTKWIDYDGTTVLHQEVGLGGKHAEDYAYAGDIPSDKVWASWQTITTDKDNQEVTYIAQLKDNPASTVGDVIDIVDWTETSVTLNLNGIPAAGWPYTINGVEYTKDQRSADRTLTILYEGNADDGLVITLTKNGGEMYSRHTYTIPHIITTSADLTGVQATSVVFAKDDAKLSVTENVSVSKIVIAPGAELSVNSGVTLTVGDLLLRTTAWKAAILDNQGKINATHTYYTRVVASNSQYYQFALPLASDVKDVMLSTKSKCTYGISWLLKSYDEASRAKNGETNTDVLSNWKQLEADAAGSAVIAASVGYEMFSNTPYYREFYFPVTLPAKTTEVPVSHTDGAAGAAHAGWNALCSPLLGKYKQTFTDVSEAIKISELTENGNYWQHIPEVIHPAVPFYYQAPKKGTLDFSGDELKQNAPRRAWHTSVSTQWLRLTLSDAVGKMLDEANIFTHPDKFSVDYESGYDVIKQSTTGGKALLYSELACGALAFAALPDSVAESRIPISVYTAEAKAHTFHLEDNAYLNRLNNVFLHDTETGAVIDLMTSDYEAMLREGTTRGRFYITCVFRAQNVTTDIETTVQDKQTATIQKVFYNGKVYILRNGIVYDLTGRQCEMK